MIDWLSIRHFAIAADLELEFDGGFSAITGETGSGKSLMVDALSVLLGARADVSLIQHGQDMAEIQCQFHLDPQHDAFDWLRERELDSDQEILLRRVIRRDRPGRGYINGRPVNISQLRELGTMLADIHGQHEHHSLMRRGVQQLLLDESASNQDLLEQIAVVYDEISDLERQRDALRREENNIRERIDLLTFQHEELARLDPQPDEWQRLDGDQKRLQHAHELASGAQAVASRLYEDDDNLNNELTRLSTQLRQLAGFDDALTGIAAMIDEAAVNLEEAATQLSGRYRDMTIDPGEIERVETRVSAFHDLSRKHRVGPEQLAAHMAAMAEELGGLQNPEAAAEKLDASIDKARSRYTGLAIRLSKSRRQAAARLGKQITAAMQEIGMQGGKFAIALESLAAGQIGRSGVETVEFQVTANPGQPLQPLARVASGGEVSRISLAIQVILAGAAKLPTLIFDEVDVGIGGTVANIVGQRLHDLGQASQVICVTHLAQVAARANQHYSVTKGKPAKGGGVNVKVEKLNQTRRVEEIARMTGSEKLTKEAKEHAEQMLATG